MGARSRKRTRREMSNGDSWCNNKREREAKPQARLCQICSQRRALVSGCSRRRAKLCRVCFQRQASISGARSIGNGNAKGSPGNNGNAKGNPGNVGHATGNPGNIGNATGNPRNTGNATGNPRNTGNTIGNPGNAGNSTGNPGNTGNATGNPGNNGNDAGNPGNAGNAIGNPGNDGNVKGNTGNAGNTAGSPGNNGSVIGSPGNIGNRKTGSDKKAAGTRSGLKRSATTALVVKKQWLDKLLTGEKDWEIRGSYTCRRGYVHFAESGAGGALRGRARLVDCIPVSKAAFGSFFNRHRIPSVEDVPYKNIYAWVFEDAERFATPFGYEHKPGAVSWVRLR